MALTSKGHFKIGSSQFAAKAIKSSYESLASEDSGRSDDGVMHITWIQTKLRKWEIEMPPCSAAVAQSILSLVQGRTYSLTIFDISTNSEQVVTCYTSNATADCYSGVISNGLWTGLSFTAIEIGTAQ